MGTRRDPATPKSIRRPGGGPRTDIAVERYVRQRTLEGYSPIQIHRSLGDMKAKGKIGRVPHIKTVRRIARSPVRDDSGPWTLAEADGEEAALVLPVLAAVMQRTEGRVTGFTTKQAEWVQKVRQAAPDLPPWHVWQAAMSYFHAVGKGREVGVLSLNALLAFAPWRSVEVMAHFLEWTRLHRPEWWGEHWVSRDGKAEGWAGMADGVMLAGDIEADQRGVSTTGVFGPMWEIVGREEKSDESPRKS